MNRHGHWKYRRSESFNEHAALVAYALARAARVTTLPAHAYREAFPIDDLMPAIRGLANA